MFLSILSILSLGTARPQYTWAYYDADVTLDFSCETTSIYWFVMNNMMFVNFIQYVQ